MSTNEDLGIILIDDDDNDDNHDTMNLNDIVSSLYDMRSSIKNKSKARQYDLTHQNSSVACVDTV